MLLNASDLWNGGGMEWFPTAWVPRLGSALASASPGGWSSSAAVPWKSSASERLTSESAASSSASDGDEGLLCCGGSLWRSSHLMQIPEEAKVSAPHLLQYGACDLESKSEVVSLSASSMASCGGWCACCSMTACLSCWYCGARRGGGGGGKEGGVEAARRP